jgi:2-desacetyl-2-hydroxyethyl bacteriochlorophyllide A dehydrogenase
MHNGQRPERASGHTLLAVKRIGICGTDIHAFHGRQPYFTYPRILGHELAAEVVEADGNDGRLSEGDIVAVMPYANCGICSACREGKTNCCVTLKVYGVHIDGGMQEFINIPSSLLIPAGDLPLEAIALIEPLSIGAHALRRSDTNRGDTVVVIGCGPIGIGLIQQAKILGANVIAVDVNPHRLEIVKNNFGADLALDVRDEPLRKVLDFTEGRLADCVFDATGIQTAIEGGPGYMRHGGKFVLVGLFKGAITFDHPSLHAKESTILCSRNATIRDFERVIEILRSGLFNVSSYVTRRVDFESIPTSFDSWASPGSQDIKIIAHFSS